MVFASLLSPKRCPSAPGTHWYVGFAFPSARGKYFTRRDISPQGPPSCPKHSPLSTGLSHHPSVMDSAMESLLNANPGHKSWENTLGIGCSRGRAVGCRGWERNGEKGRLNSVMIALPVCFGGLFLLNVGKKPFRRVHTTTLQRFPPPPRTCLVSAGLHLGVQRLRGARTPPSTPTSQRGGRFSPTRGVSPPGSSIDRPCETAFVCVSLSACKSGVFQELLGAAAPCGLGSASPQPAGLGAREMFRFLLCCETVMATRSHPAPRGEQTTKPLLRGLGLIYFCFAKGKNTPLHSGDPCGDGRLHRAHAASSRAPRLQPWDHFADVTPISQWRNWVYELLFPICSSFGCPVGTTPGWDSALLRQPTIQACLMDTN